MRWKLVCGGMLGDKCFVLKRIEHVEGCILVYTLQIINGINLYINVLMLLQQTKTDVCYCYIFIALCLFFSSARCVCYNINWYIIGDWVVLT